MFRRRFPSVKFHEYGHCLGVACVGRGQSRWCFVLNFDVCKRVHLNDFILNLISFRVFFGVLRPSPPGCFHPFVPPRFFSPRKFPPLGFFSPGGKLPGGKNQGGTQGWKLPGGKVSVTVLWACISAHIHLCVHICTLD